MATKYKVTYFDIRGVAEPIRFLLSHMNEDFEDNCVERKDWPKLKQKTPFGKLPILEMDGEQYTQSIPLYRYLGKKAKLAGNNDLEDLNIDIIADVLLDLRIAVSEAQYETDEQSKKIKKNTVVNETLPFILKRLEDVANNNNGFLANGKLSWVDFMFASIAENLNFFFESTDCFEDFPNLNTLMEKVLSFPMIVSWMAKRPDTQF